MREKIARPFLQWAGGKGRLINQLALQLPQEVMKSKFTYIEPFVGGGAVLFWLLNTFPNMEKVVINDINEDLINVYRIIAHKPKELIEVLEFFQAEYHSLKDYDSKKAYFYVKRELYNTRSELATVQAALFILLNKICFNGVYRVNSKNQFNVSFGTSLTATICDKDNIILVNEKLQKVEILCGDFERTFDYVDDNTFLFFDPPYKPLSKTASFNSYSKSGFGDLEQVRLRDYCIKLHQRGCQWMLCNSDLKSVNADDNFFEKLYASFNFNYVTVQRNINSKSERRGKVNELVISNYT